MLAYSNPSLMDSPLALPDAEIFYRSAVAALADGWPREGWYYWYCTPGCLPDSEPVGPFTSSVEARAALLSDDRI
jgi:hypothetical protein